MTRSMARWTFAGCLALGALPAASVLDVGSATAEAARIDSPFAGTFRFAGAWPATVRISDRGRIRSSYEGSQRNQGSIKGRVSADGSYSFKLKRTYFFDSRLKRTDLLDIDPRRYGSGRWYTSRSRYAGTMASDRDGNVFLTDDTRGSFSWLRQ